MSDLRVLFTKKIAEEQLCELQETNIHITSYDFIKIKKCAISLHTEEMALPYLIFTSRNAVYIASHYFKPTPTQIIYAVGKKTAETVKKIWGHESKVPLSEDADGLVDLLKHDAADNILYFCGKKRRKTLEKYFSESSIRYSCKESYETILCQPVGLSAKVFDILCFCSSSAVESYLKSYRIFPHHETLAIGRTTAKYLKKYTKKIKVAPEASVDSMINYLKTKFNNNEYYTE